MMGFNKGNYCLLFNHYQNKGKIMARFQENYKTLKQALNDVYKVYPLKSLAKQINKNYPIRKAEMVDHITSLLFKNIGTIIATLDSMAVNALAEAVHNWGGVFKNKQFYAKYGTFPMAGSKQILTDKKMNRLCPNGMADASYWAAATIRLISSTMYRGRLISL